MSAVQSADFCYDAVAAYIAVIVDEPTVKSLMSFVQELQSRFYPHQDISFMEYFLELSKRSNDGQFIVPAKKLIEYGIMVNSNDSGDIKKRIRGLRLIEGEDYLIGKLSENAKSTPKDGRPPNIYMLTPRAFKLALMRANRHKAHTIDVTQYANYYLFLEIAVSYYSDYQSELQAKCDIIIRRRDDTISDCKDTINRLEATMSEQTQKINQLLAFSERAVGEREEMRDELHVMRDEVHSTREEVQLTREELHMTREDVKVVEKQLEEKCFVSTKNPESKDLHHHALVVEKNRRFSHEIRFISGQSVYVDGRKDALLADGYSISTDKFYQANGIDYRRNVQTTINKHIDDVLQPINAPIIERLEALAREIEESNLMLAEDIPQWNAQLADRVAEHNKTARAKVRLSANGKRYTYGRNQTFARVRIYEDEQRSFAKESRAKRFRLTKLPIVVNATYLNWKPNKYVSLSKIKELIEIVNEETQLSPRSSESD